MSEEYDVVLPQALHERLQVICSEAIAAGIKHIISGRELAASDDPQVRAADGQRQYAYRLKCWTDTNFEPLRQMIFAAIDADGEEALVTPVKLQQLIAAKVLRSALVFYQPEDGVA